MIVIYYNHSIGKPKPEINSVVFLTHRHRQLSSPSINCLRRPFVYTIHP
jgi:hypothetical protein